MPSPPEADFPNISTLTEEFDFRFLLDQRWARWEGTKFDIPRQISKLAIDYSLALREGKDSHEVISEWVRETTEDLGAFWGEFLCQHLVLPIKIRREIIEGKTEVVCPNYGNRKLAEITSPRERNGAEKEGVTKVANFLATASHNSMAVFINPSGWSGLTNSDGAPKIYPETQVYLYRINLFGQIEAITVRVDLSLSQCQALHYILNGGQTNFPSSAPNNQIIESVVRSPVLREGNEAPVNFEQVITALQKIKGTEQALSYVENYRLVRRTFAELWEHFHQRFTLAEQDQGTRATIKWFQLQLEKYCSLTTNSLEEIAALLERTILGISYLRSHLRNERPVIISDTYTPPRLTEDETRAEIAYIQSRPGCVAEANGRTVIDSPLGPKVIKSQENSSEYIHCGKCPGKTGQFLEGEAVCINAHKRF